MSRVILAPVSLFSLLICALLFLVITSAYAQQTDPGDGAFFDAPQTDPGDGALYNDIPQTDPGDGALNNSGSYDWGLDSQPSGNTGVDDWTKNSTGELGVDSNQPGLNINSSQQGLGVNSPSGGSAKLTNPITAKTLDEFIIKIIDVLLVFAVPLIVLYIMYAGYLFVTAAGKAEQITQARTALLYALVGGVIVLGAKLIITVIEGTVKAF